MMARKTTDRVFDAEAKSLYELFMSEGGVAGFRIPIYQRHYNWDKENINRLLEDILSGLSWHATSEDSLTFIGTIIVLDEDTDERTFDGRSLSIIDGQQRLTTISLLACVLHEALGEKTGTLGKIQGYVANWIKDESQLLRNRLLGFVRGSLPVNGYYFPFPRLVREEVDTRGNDASESEYRSLIANYLNKFAQHVQDKNVSQVKFNLKPKPPVEPAFDRNLNVIKKFSDILSSDNDEEVEEISTTLFSSNKFEERGTRKLFKKLPSKQPEINRIFSYCGQKGDKFIGTLRLISFTAYLMDSVIVTLVKARDEKYGFDIFDALNTTGEPLTAVQTFKPLVVKFEKDEGRGYLGSVCETDLKAIEKYLDKFTGSDARQRETKDLIIPFALYLTGKKISRSLDEQRRYLRKTFERITGKSSKDTKRRFVHRLFEIADYKEKFWLNSNIQIQLQGYPDERELILLCLKFLKDLNNSLSIPILCRYYTKAQNTDNKELFIGAVKALTAFVAIRRGATGGTSGIDSDLRSLMSIGRRKNVPTTMPICAGLQKGKPIPDIPILREYLRDWLSKKKIEIHNKDSWVKKVSSQQLAAASKPLCRFLMLAAAHNSRPDKSEPWKLVKSRKGAETEYLTLKRWVSDELATVEHIAPESPPNSGWDAAIYSQPFLKHCLGNLTLLPQEENSTAANSSWSKKKNLYKAFAAETDEEVDKIIAESKKEGVNFSKKNLENLRKRPQLPLAKSVASVEKWTKKVIEKRSKNLAELAWDEIEDWLFQV